LLRNDARIENWSYAAVAKDKFYFLIVFVDGKNNYTWVKTIWGVGDWLFAVFAEFKRSERDQSETFSILSVGIVHNRMNFNVFQEELPFVSITKVS
jgi:hypothetical protein